MKKFSLYAMSALYITTGAMHFIHPAFFRAIMPAWVPLHDELVVVSGVCEILFALLLLFPFTRVMAAWCIVGLLVAVFPANIQMMLNYLHENNPQLWLTVLRLPLQVILIWWAYIFTKAERHNAA